MRRDAQIRRREIAVDHVKFIVAVVVVGRRRDVQRDRDRSVARNASDLSRRRHVHHVLHRESSSKGRGLKNVSAFDETISRQALNKLV